MAFVENGKGERRGWRLRFRRVDRRVLDALLMGFEGLVSLSE